MERSKATQPPADIKNAVGPSRSNRAILLIAALDMSWRLAIAVLVPIIGGYELDRHLGITPALTILGFLVAMAGLFFILKRTLALTDSKYKTGIRK